MSFSAVVVIHDSAPELERLLDSIDGHLAAEPPQLIVVDSGSRDEGGRLARDRGAEVVELPDNPGFGPATNAGGARAERPVTALLNPDVELLDDGLAALAGRAASREALLAPRLVDAHGSVQDSAHPLPGGAGALLLALSHPPLLPRRLRLAAQPWRSDACREVGWALAAALVAPTETLRRLGPFDPGAFLFYEDLDLCLRAREAGVPTELHPDVRLRHAGGHSVEPAFGGEPHEPMARRRREVVEARLGRRARAVDDALQGLTFATRIATRSVLGRDASRPRAQLRALRSARSG